MIRAVVLIALTSTAAMAADGPGMPQYDVGAYCKADANEKNCLLFAYNARSLVSRAWPAAPAAVRDECITTTGRFSDYSLLYGCLDSHKNDAKVMTK